LNVCYSPISHNEFVAIFLSEIFPNLAHIESANPVDFAIPTGRRIHHRRWQKIGKVLLPTLRMTKKRERQRLSPSGGNSDQESPDDEEATSRLGAY
jgi:hypothetical protein